MKKTVSVNRKAYHDYFIEDRYEAGIELLGTEIKAIRKGSAQLKDSYIEFTKGEAFVRDMYIGPYDHGNRYNHEERRLRKLLLHKSEIRKWADKVQVKGYTVVPLELYLEKGLAKLEIGLARGKDLYDKRQTLKERDQKREIDKAMKNFH